MSSRLLSSLRSIGVPGLDHVEASDLDHVFQTNDEEVKRLLNAISSQIERGQLTLLTEAEAEFATEAESDHFLTGESLQKALKDVDDDEEEENARFDEDDLMSSGEKLTLTEAELASTAKLRDALTTAKSRQMIKIAHLRQRLEKLQAKKVPFSDAIHDEAVQRCSEVVDGVKKRLEDGQSLLANADLIAIAETESIVVENFLAKAEKIFNVSQDEEEKDASELQRLREAKIAADFKKATSSIEAEAKKAVLDANFRVTEGIGEDALERKIRDQLLPQVQRLKTQLEASLEKDFESEVLVLNMTDLQNQRQRLLAIKGQLDNLERLARNQQKRQNAVGKRLDDEIRALKSLQELFKLIKAENIEGLKAKMDAEEIAVKNLKAFESQARDRQNDVVLKTLKLEKAAWVDLLEKAKKLNEEKKVKNKDLKTTIEQFESDVAKLEGILLKESTDVQDVLSELKERLSQGQKLLQVKLEAWAKAKANKASPLETQRNLWIDFLIQPKLMEANVEAIRKKADL